MCWDVSLLSAPVPSRVSGSPACYVQTQWLDWVAFLPHFLHLSPAPFNSHPQALFPFLWVLSRFTLVDSSLRTQRGKGQLHVTHLKRSPRYRDVDGVYFLGQVCRNDHESIANFRMFNVLGVIIPSQWQTESVYLRVFGNCLLFVVAEWDPYFQM